MPRFFPFPRPPLHTQTRTTHTHKPILPLLGSNSIYAHTAGICRCTSPRHGLSYNAYPPYQYPPCLTNTVPPPSARLPPFLFSVSRSLSVVAKNQKGYTFLSVAPRFGTTWQALWSLNAIPSPDLTPVIFPLYLHTTLSYLPP